MGYGVSLSVVLAILWAVLSGYFDKPILLILGAVSVILAMGLAYRMRIIDRETAPFFRLGTLIPYYMWLGREITMANVAVVKTSLKPEIDITPRLVRVPVEARSDLGRCIFANSITLTPGTVTVEIEEDGYLVHALSPDFTSPDDFAQMNANSDIATDGRRSSS
jgi:multicomponent Na+:H+ antiporter subunit E